MLMRKQGGSKAEQVYRVKFEGDNDEVKEVAAHNVIPYPGSP